MKDLILDLQDNGGGYLQAAVEIANEFLPKDDLIVYTDGRRIRRMDYKARGNGSFLTGRVYVLVNEFTRRPQRLLPELYKTTTAA